MEVTVLSFWVSVVAAILAIVSIIQAIVLRQSSKRESQEASESLIKQNDEALSFITHLIVNSAADPQTVRRMLEDYNRVGKWRGQVSKIPGGYRIDWTP